MSQNVKQHTVIQHGELQHAATPMHSKLMAIVAQYRNVNMETEEMVKPVRLLLRCPY